MGFNKKKRYKGKLGGRTGRLEWSKILSSWIFHFKKGMPFYKILDKSHLDKIKVTSK